MRTKVSLLLLTLSTGITSLYAQTGNIGIGTTSPATRLDVNGSFRTEVLSPNVNGGSGNIPLTTSAFTVADGNFANPLTLPASAPSGQRMVIYSTATFTTAISTANTSLTTPISLNTGETYEFISNGTSWNINPTADPAKRYDYDWMKAGNTFPHSPGDTAQNIYHIGGNVGVGTNAPQAQLHIRGTAPQIIGTLSTMPTANQFMGLIGFGGNNGGATDYQSAGINAYATENWTSTAAGSELSLITTPNGTATRTLRMLLNHDGNVGIFQNGNAGINPLTLLHLRLQSSGGAGVFNTNTANMALRLENLNNGQSVIQHFLTKNTSAATKEFIMGINPDYSTNGLSGVFLLSRNGSNDLVFDLASGNVAIGGLPDTAGTTKLTVGGKVKIIDGTQGANKVLTSDANGLASWKDGPLGLFVKSAGTQVWSGAATVTDWIATTNNFGSAWNGSVFTVPAGMQGWYTIHTGYQTSANGASARTPFGHIQIMVNGTAVVIGTASVHVEGGTVNGVAPGAGSAVASISYYLNVGDQVSIIGNHLTYLVPANTSTSISADPLHTYLSILKQ